jgi:DNA-directed RNA polymerase subunit RPC12/RpoP
MRGEESMRDVFAKVRNQLGAGLIKATTKSRVTLETVRLQRQIHTLAKEKEQALAQLGAQVYTAVCQRGQVEQGEVSAAVTRLQERDRAIESLQQEITRLEALEAATPWFGAGAPSIASCTCGTPLPTGAKFCENCGADVQELVATAEAEQRARAEAAQQAGGAALCPQCGARISSARAKFCRHCGAAFSGTSETSRPD